MKRIQISLLLLALAGLLVTCRDLLDVAPNDRIDLDSFYASPADAEAALIGAYNYTFRSDLLSNIIFYSNRSSDDLTSPLEGRQSDPLMFRPALNSGSGEPAGLWRASYEALATINLLLERAPAINENLFNNANPGSGTAQVNRKAALLGEAHFLRAFIYYHLVQFFGDVPLITEFPKSSRPEDNRVPRTPKAQVMQQVMDDLDFATENLPWNHNNLGVLDADQLIQSKGRATKGAALLLRARIHQQNREWQKAIDLCREIIGSGQFRLVERWVTIFDAGNGSQNTSESILEVQTRTGPGEFNNTGGYAWFHQDGRPRRGATLEAYNLFEGTAAEPLDVRKVFSMSQRTDNPDQIYAVKYANSFPWWAPEDPFNFVPMRLTECYLIIAEALNELGFPNDEAMAYINLIRERSKDLNFTTGPIPGVEPFSFADIRSQAEFRQKIREERRRELMFEGHRFFDLMRYDAMDNGDRTMKALGLTSPEKLMFPIPESELVNNPLLTQNPGY